LAVVPSTAPSATTPDRSPKSEPVGPQDVPTREGTLNAVWIGDGTIVVGGFTGPSFESTISFFDGTSWSVADIPGAPGQVTGVALIGDRLVAVGNGLPEVTEGFIWDSTDGRSWREVEAIEGAALHDVAAGDGVVVAVGALLDAEMNTTAAVWSSTDGATWEQATVAAPEGTSMGSVAATPDGFVATGDRPLGVARPLWSATTASGGTTWASVENDLDDQLLPSDIVHGTVGLALVGASGKSGDQHPFVALSTGGAQWAQTNLSGEEGYASAVAEVNGRLVVAGVDADRLTVWSLRDEAWQAATIEPEGASISAMAWDAEWGLLAVGSRDGRHAVWQLGSE
jgi:hypothetical protein